MPSLLPLSFLVLLFALLLSAVAQDAANTKTLVSGFNHILAKRAAAIECYPGCCKLCAAGKRKICKKKLIGMLPPGCENGTYCDESCVLALVKKFVNLQTGK